MWVQVAQESSLPHLQYNQIDLRAAMKEHPILYPSVWLTVAALLCLQTVEAAWLQHPGDPLPGLPYSEARQLSRWLAQIPI